MIVGGITLLGQTFLISEQRKNNRLCIQLIDLETNVVKVENKSFDFIALNEIAWSDVETLLALEQSGYVVRTPKKINVNGVDYRVVTWI